MDQVQFMSDLHLERINYQFTISKNAPFLILAGDIGRFCDYEKYRDFLIKLCAPGMFELVLLVAGNHEFYGSSREEGLQSANQLVNEPAMHGRLRFLNQTRVDLPGTAVTVLGCTLHSHIAPDYTALTNDFARIKNWSVQKHNAEHAEDLAWLQASLREIQRGQPERQVIVATHYAPMLDGVCHPKHENSPLSQCFSTTALDGMLAKRRIPSGTRWIFGHTHWNARIKRGEAVILSNQLCCDDKDLTWWQRMRLCRPFDAQALVT